MHPTVIIEVNISCHLFVFASEIKYNMCFTVDTTTTTEVSTTPNTQTTTEGGVLNQNRTAFVSEIH